MLNGFDTVRSNEFDCTLVILLVSVTLLPAIVFLRVPRAFAFKPLEKVILQIPLAFPLLGFDIVIPVMEIVFVTVFREKLGVPQPEEVGVTDWSSKLEARE